MKPRLAKGTRDFLPEDMKLRRHIFNVIREQFEVFGFEEIETPAVESLDTLTGKYGEEGDKLIFKILNSGDYLKSVDQSLLDQRSIDKMLPLISEKALRYDLTVPFARFVTQHRNELTFPFRRYQIQPVWRADRPQKGRYREFYQCDADIIGSDSLLLEAELINLIDKVYKSLEIKVTVKINNRKLLQAFCEINGISDKFVEFTVILDKLDKKGWEALKPEFIELGLSNDTVNDLNSLIGKSGQSLNKENVKDLESLFNSSETGAKGVSELNELATYLEINKPEFVNVQLDLSLARGLNYYTGAIIEVVADEVEMGSLCGGGRYDDLTDIFGMPGMSGIGISFGIDRIYDVLKSQDIRGNENADSKSILVTNLGGEALEIGLKLTEELRKSGFPTEIYPDNDKLKKQFKYADQKNKDFIVIIGEHEVSNNTVSLKNMQSGEQMELGIDQVISHIQL